MSDGILLCCCCLVVVPTSTLSERGCPEWRSDEITAASDWLKHPGSVSANGQWSEPGPDTRHRLCFFENKAKVDPLDDPRRGVMMDRRLLWLELPPPQVTFCSGRGCVLLVCYVRLVGAPLVLQPFMRPELCSSLYPHCACSRRLFGEDLQAAPRAPPTPPQHTAHG